MSNKFALSVLLPLYMDETFPEELVYQNVDSLISQTFDDFEIVISDDLPGDKSKKLLQHIKSQSSVFFKYVVNKENNQKLTTPRLSIDEISSPSLADSDTS